MDKNITDLSAADAGQYLYKLLLQANLQNTTFVEPPDRPIDLTVQSNEAFWQPFIQRDERPLPALKWITLENFQLCDWFPRTPGVFFTELAAEARYLERARVIRVEGFNHYAPDGKKRMIDTGGIGCLRFKPIKIEGLDCWLYTATSDDFCHTGVPLLIPNKVLTQINFDLSRRVKVIGEIRFLPDILEPYFRDWVKIPQIYVHVDRIEALPMASTPIEVTPTVLFSFDPQKSEEYFHNIRKSVHWWYPRGGDFGLTFVTCYPDQMDLACSRIERYVDMYGQAILTNFDQQSPTWPGVPFNLDKIMEGRLSATDFERVNIHIEHAAIERVNTIHTESTKINQGIELNASGNSTINTGDVNLTRNQDDPSL
ncbi:MAG: hypothetical protein MUF87_09910 [Anaerolineae bacterium]|nr:hypothetical protein [Anaerolineae bacterium]